MLLSLVNSGVRSLGCWNVPWQQNIVYVIRRRVHDNSGSREYARSTGIAVRDRMVSRAVHVHASLA